MSSSSLVVFVDIPDTEDNLPLYNIAKSVAANVTYIKDYSQFSPPQSSKYCLVSTDFESDFFMKVRNTVRSIISPQLSHINDHKTIPVLRRPTYNEKLKNVVVSLSCDCPSALLSKYVTLLHNMSAIVKKSPTEGTQLVVTNRSDLPESIQGIAMEIPVVKESWITKSWTHKDDDSFSPIGQEFVASQEIKCFYGLSIAFSGFSEEDYMYCAQLVLDGDGVDVMDNKCSHIIVSPDSTTPPVIIKTGINIVTAEWFWRCVQVSMYLNVNSYIYDFDVCIDKKNIFDMLEDQPKSQLVYEKSSRSENSVDDETRTKTSSVHSSTIQHGSQKSSNPEAIVQNKTRRQCIFDELYTTEKNFCGVLEFIGKSIRDELLHMVGNPSKELISINNINFIFGSISQLYDVHRQIFYELTKISTNWSEKSLIGRVYLERIIPLTIVYQKFTNNYKECIARIKTLMGENPRFMAFLKLKESIEVCGRQRLVELYIKPIQRIPQTILLLQELLKYTSEKVADYSHLLEVLSKLRESLSKINEFCRENDNYVLMLRVLNDISKCPETLRSSSRRLLLKIYTIELSNLLVKEGDEIIMCVFNDCLELCKVRKKSNISGNSKHNKKMKHIALFPLSSVRRLISVTDDDRIFAIVWQSINCMSDLICAFSFVREEMTFNEDRNKTIHALARHINDATCANDSSLILSCNLDSLPSNVIQSKMTRLTNTLSRMFSFKSHEVGHAKKSVQFTHSENIQNITNNDDFESASLYSYDSTVIKRLSRKGSVSNSLFSISSEAGPDRRQSKRSSIFGKMRSKRTI